MENSVEAGNLNSDGVEIYRVHDVSPKNFAIVGERCSGTNLAHFLVRKHLPCLCDYQNAYGWKHGFPVEVGYAKNTLLIVLFRDVFTWIKSLYKKPWHSTEVVQNRDFSAFIRGSWETRIFPPEHFGVRPQDAVVNQPLQFDRHPISGKLFDTPLDLRVAKNQAFIGLKNRDVNVVYVQMETLINDPKLFLSCLAIAFDLPFPGKVRLPKNILGAGFIPSITNQVPAPETISQHDRGFILQRLDLDTEAEIGYSYLED